MPAWSAHQLKLDSFGQEYSNCTLCVSMTLQQLSSTDKKPSATINNFANVDGRKISTTHTEYIHHGSLTAKIIGDGWILNIGVIGSLELVL